MPLNDASSAPQAGAWQFEARRSEGLKTAVRAIAGSSSARFAAQAAPAASLLRCNESQSAIGSLPRRPHATRIMLRRHRTGSPVWRDHALTRKYKDLFTEQVFTRGPKHHRHEPTNTRKHSKTPLPRLQGWGPPRAPRRAAMSSRPGRGSQLHAPLVATTVRPGPAASELPPLRSLTVWTVRRLTARLLGCVRQAAKPLLSGYVRCVCVCRWLGRSLSASYNKFTEAVSHIRTRDAIEEVAAHPERRNNGKRRYSRRAAIHSSNLRILSLAHSYFCRLFRFQADILDGILDDNEEPADFAAADPQTSREPPSASRRCARRLRSR